MKKTKIFIIQGYETKDATGNLGDVCTFEIIADSVDKAIKVAQSIQKKLEYRVTSYIEKEK